MTTDTLAAAIGAAVTVAWVLYLLAGWRAEKALRRLSQALRRQGDRP